VYNTRELEQLVDGQHFSSDTDLLSTLLRRFGIGIVSHIKGEFAFAFFDGNTLFLVRDRMGVKPLYYHADEQTVFFSSEIKGIVPALEQTTLHPLDLKSYVKPYGAYTPLAEVQQVLPGQVVSFSKTERGVQQEKITYTLLKKHGSLQSAENARELIKRVFEKSVESMLVSDTPIGILLSGGIDSAILAYTVSQLTNQNVKAYCVGSAHHNEFEGAQAIADEYGYILKTIELRESDVLSAARKTVKTIETYDAGPLPTAVAMQRLFSGIRRNVVLSGEGPDELFGGYAEVFSAFHQATPDYALLKKETENATRCMYQRQLARLDKVSMAQGIEARVPFLHTDFVSLAQQIDSRLKYRPRREKAVLFDAFKDILPEKIKGVHKQRFGVAAGTKDLLEHHTQGLQEFALETFKKEYGILEEAIA
jgi:asparagine synthase (glutamine-hydrolysing)